MDHTFTPGDTDSYTVSTAASIAASSILSLGSVSATLGCSLGTAVKPTSKSVSFVSPPSKSSVVSSAKQPPQVSEEEYLDPNDPDGIEFVGAFIVDNSTDDVAWVSSAEDPDDFSPTVGVSVDD